MKRATEIAGAVALVVAGATTYGAVSQGWVNPNNQEMTDSDSKSKAVQGIETPPSFTPITTPTGEVIRVVPVTPTTEPTRAPTQVPAETATPAPIKPQSEKMFSTGLIERYGMVTEKNLDNYFSRVSQEELQMLLKEQPDLPLFPFVPLSDQFSIGEIEYQADEQTFKEIIVYSTHLLVVADYNGLIKYVNTPSGISSINLAEKLSETTTLGSGYRVLGEKPKLTPKINAPDWLSKDKGQPVKKGDALAEFLGSGPYNSPGKYSATVNQIRFEISKSETLPEPIKQGTMKIFSRNTNLTPFLSDAFDWVHTKEGKIAISY